MDVDFHRWAFTQTPPLHLPSNSVSVCFEPFVCHSRKQSSINSDESSIILETTSEAIVSRAALGLKLPWYSIASNRWDNTLLMSLRNLPRYLSSASRKWENNSHGNLSNLLLDQSQNEAGSGDYLVVWISQGTKCNIPVPNVFFIARQLRAASRRFWSLFLHSIYSTSIGCCRPFLGCGRLG